MNNKIVLIRGALSGVGRAAALAFAAEGAQLVVSGRDDLLGVALAEEVRNMGGKAEYVRARLCCDEEVRGLIDRIVKDFGCIDMAVNVPGTECTPCLLVEQTVEAYAATFDTNVLATLLGMKHQLRVMRAFGHGSIVNVVSSFDHGGDAGASLYAGCKHAIEAITKSAAQEAAAFGVRVNAVVPGSVETVTFSRFRRNDPTAPFKRTGRLDEIAHAILFVASDKASLITGQIVAADGGKSVGCNLGDAQACSRIVNGHA